MSDGPDAPRVEPVAPPSAILAIALVGWSTLAIALAAAAICYLYAALALGFAWKRPLTNLD